MGGGSTSSSWSASYNTSSSASVTRRPARSFAIDDRREYTGERTGGIEAPVGRELISESEFPIVLMLDVTGSMREWPRTIMKKLPVWYAETNFAVQGLSPEDVEEKKRKGETIEDKIELSIIAVGDATCDRYPLQVTEFRQSGALVNEINRIYPEGGGGGTTQESYELAGYYLLNHCKTPKVLPGMKPVLIIAGDEGYYSEVSKFFARKLTGDNMQQEIESKAMWKELAKKFDIYVLRPEICYTESEYRQIHQQWTDTFGEQRVMKMACPERIVDCMIGVAGYAAGQLDKSRDWLERRQSEEQVKEVLEALHPLTGGKKRGR